MMLRDKKGQSVLEYVIVWTAIVTAILVGAYAALNKTGALTKPLESATEVIEKAATDFSTNMGVTPSGGGGGG